MKKILVLALVGMILAASMTQADFPRRGRSCSSPAFYPCYHETPYVAPVVASAVTTIIQEPLPVFVFQNYSGFPNMPAAVPQQQYTPQAATPPQIGLSDRDVDRIANVVVQRLQGASAVVQQTNLIMPPVVAADEKPMVMSQQIANQIGMACASCHMAGTATKGGLAIFNANRQFEPTKNGQPYDNPLRLFERANEGSMPPTAATDPSKRLNPEALAFLKTWSGQ